VGGARASLLHSLQGLVVGGARASLLHLRQGLVVGDARASLLHLRQGLVAVGYPLATQSVALHHPPLPWKQRVQLVVPTAVEQRYQQSATVSEPSWRPILEYLEVPSLCHRIFSKNYGCLSRPLANMLSAAALAWTFFSRMAFLYLHHHNRHRHRHRLLRF